MHTADPSSAHQGRSDPGPSTLVTMEAKPAWGWLVLPCLSTGPQARDAAGASASTLLPGPHRPLALGSRLGHRKGLTALSAKGAQTPPANCPQLPTFAAPPSPVCLYVPSLPGVPIPPDPTCSSLWLEEMSSARGAGLVTPWTMQSCGKGEAAARPCAIWAGGRGGPQWTPSTVWRCGEALRV